MDQKLFNIFKNTFNLEENKINDFIKYEQLEGWDSMGHLMLITAIEKDYGISLLPDEVIIMGDIPTIEKIIQGHLNREGNESITY